MRRILLQLVLAGALCMSALAGGLPADIEPYFLQLLRNQASNDASRWASDFANPTRYCYKTSGPASLAYLTVDRQKLIDRYPRRTYSDIEVIGFTRLAPRHAMLTYRYHYDYSGARETSGNCVVLLELVFSGGRWWVVEFREAVDSGASRYVSRLPANIEAPHSGAETPEERRTRLVIQLGICVFAKLAALPQAGDELDAQIIKAVFSKGADMGIASTIEEAFPRLSPSECRIVTLAFCSLLEGPLETLPQRMTKSYILDTITERDPSLGYSLQLADFLHGAYVNRRAK